MQQIKYEKEVLSEVPRLLGTFLEDADPGQPRLLGAKESADFEISVGGRVWVGEVKAHSSPGIVAACADRFREIENRNAIPVLVVPYMSNSGAEVASQRRLNWIDLSGNARLRAKNLYVQVEGRPNQFRERGRPASAFAPRSSRVARRLLIDPERWWVQNELASKIQLDPSQVSRAVGRLDDQRLLERKGKRFRPLDPYLLLDAWGEDYRFDRHEIVDGHISGKGPEMAVDLSGRLSELEIGHAFTGLAAAWAVENFSRFRILTLYVEGDPHLVAQKLGLRSLDRGANIQVVGPDDLGVFDGKKAINGLPCVSRPQMYLDLLNLPERGPDAARQLRSDGELWGQDV